MLFQTFRSQAERRRQGGSCFVELQFCRMPPGTPVRRLVDVDSIRNWMDDSLYVDDETVLYREYGRFFTGGVYNNLRRGPVDLYGINYYESAMIDPLMERLRREQPPEYETLMGWLERAKDYNGFYILGI